jgi:hypothetical protein
MASSPMVDAAAISRAVANCSMPMSRVQPPSPDNRTKGDYSFRAADFAICPDCGGAMRRIAAYHAPPTLNRSAPR